MKRVALVVGINRYPFLKDTPNSPPRHLTTATRDAEAIARLLEIYGNFEVLRLPTGQDLWEFAQEKLVKVEELKSAITQLFQPEDNSTPYTALLYFAGNGLRREHTNNNTEGFLATSDSSARKDKWGVSLKWLREVLQTSPVPQQVVWLDCSYSGELFNFIEKDVTIRNSDRCFITASKADEFAHARNGRGLLTSIILNSLQPENSADGRITNYLLTDSLPSKFTFVDDNLKQPKYQFPQFENKGTPIIFTAVRGFNDWFTSQQHPLERLWADTKGWFSSEGYEDSFPLVKIHEASRVGKYFGETSKDKEKANQYKHDIETALGVTLPESWWQDKDSVKNLHESLKCLCGDCFCGQTDNLLIKRSLSIGAAYLIALMAHQNIWGNVTLLTKTVPNWTGNHLSSSKLFPLQPSSLAREAAKSLYDFFYHLFKDRNNQSMSQVKGALLNPPGNSFQIQFTWKANSNAKNRSSRESLSASMINIVNTQKISIPEYATNTKTALIRLWKCMLASEQGFMSPGIIYMEEDILVITSFQQ